MTLDDKAIAGMGRADLIATIRELERRAADLGGAAQVARIGEEFYRSALCLAEKSARRNARVSRGLRAEIRQLSELVTLAMTAGLAECERLRGELARLRIDMALDRASIVSPLRDWHFGRESAEETLYALRDALFIEGDYVDDDGSGTSDSSEE